MDSFFADDGGGEEESFAAVEQEVDAAAPPQPEEVLPRANPDFLGHEAAESALLQDYLAGRFPHALVLAGPAGIGKATLAFRLARFLFSQGQGQGGGLFGAPAPPKSLHVALEHPAFRRVASGGHADLLTVEREFDEKRGRFKNDISVEAVRRVHPFLHMTASEGGWRVVIVDGAECLNASSQNALLKILEEPPEKALLVLVTSQPGLLLPTIRSRCRMLHLEPLPEKAISALLDRMVPGLGAGEKAALSRLAQGSIGKALQFQQDGGMEIYRQLSGVVASLPELDMIKVHGLADSLAKYGAEKNFETAMDIMMGWCERQARAEARGQQAAEVLSGDAAVFEKIRAQYPPRHFFNAWEKISALVRQTEACNLDKRQAVIGAFLALQKPDYQGVSP